jgi:hypothetical protein
VVHVQERLVLAVIAVVVCIMDVQFFPVYAQVLVLLARALYKVVVLETQAIVHIAVNNLELHF